MSFATIFFAYLFLKKKKEERLWFLIYFASYGFFLFPLLLTLFYLLNPKETNLDHLNPTPKEVAYLGVR